MAHKSFKPWLMVVLLAVVIAAGLLLLQADTVLAPVLPIASDLDRVAIYGAVIRPSIRVSGADLPKGAIYILGNTDERAGDPTLQDPASAAISPALREGLNAALADFQMKIVWLESAAQLDIDEKSTRLRDGGVFITLGNLRQQVGGKVWVSIRTFYGRLDGTGRTYVVEKVNGVWTITGKTGKEWIA